MSFCRRFLLAIVLTVAGFCFCADISAQVAANSGGDAAPTAVRTRAEQGDPDAQYFLARFYDSQRNYAAAAEWFEKAAYRGHSDAQVILGGYYRDGLGVAKNDVQAAYWYRRAADLGDADAQFKLANLYFLGRGVLQDFQHATEWYRKSAEQGNYEAQYALAVSYASGQGVPVDNVQAYMWMNLAATSPFITLEDQRSRAEFRDAIARNMTPQQIAEAQRRAAQWRVGGPVAGSASASTRIRLTSQNGTFGVPVRINDVLTLSFTVDSGASDVLIPSDVFDTLYRTGTIRETDFIGEQQYRLADGSIVKSRTFRLRTLAVGDRTVENVTASVTDSKGSLLLGQSFLSRFASWAIDNDTHELVLR